MGSSCDIVFHDIFVFNVTGNRFNVECNRVSIMIGTVAVCKHWNLYTNFALWLVDSLTPTRTDQPQSEVTVQISNVYTGLHCPLLDCLESNITIGSCVSTVVSDVHARVVVTFPARGLRNNNIIWPDTDLDIRLG